MILLNTSLTRFKQKRGRKKNLAVLPYGGTVTLITGILENYVFLPQIM